ncbi:MAG: hypothetical protein [Bacteriophage sp.]|nr:MAG: hypothetical protein [Bacteriophage sp.]
MRRSIFDTGNRELPTFDHPVPTPSSKSIDIVDNNLETQKEPIVNKLEQQVGFLSNRLDMVERDLIRVQRDVNKQKNSTKLDIPLLVLLALNSIVLLISIFTS